MTRQACQRSHDKTSKAMMRNNIATFNDIMSDKYDIIHRRLYDNALKAYYADKAIDASQYTAREIVTSSDVKSLMLPSKALITERVYPYKHYIIDLTSYWETYKFDDFDNDGIAQKMLPNDYADEFVICYRDYVRGYAEVEGRMSGIHFKIPLSEASGLEDIHDDNGIKTTFGYKLRNKIYGV